MSNTKKIKVKKKKEEEKVDELTMMVRESLGSMGRRVAPAQEQMLVGIYKSFIVGGVSNIIDFVIFIILVLLTSLSSLWVNVISFVIALGYGIFMSFKYRFPKNNYQKPLCIYLGLSVVGLLVTEGLLWGLHITLQWPSILVKLLAIILVILIKWGLQKPFIKKIKHLDEMFFLYS